MPTLRPYQEKIISEVREQFKLGVRSVLVCSPTGSGKTTLTANMIKIAVQHGNKVWVILHRRELVRQFAKALDADGVQFDIVASGFISTTGKPVKLCSIGTIRNRLKRLQAPNMIVWDECHHLGAKTFKKIYENFPEAYHIGLSATPERLDSQGLRTWFKSMVYGPSVADLIKQGYLSDYIPVVPPGGMNLEGLHMRGGDFAKEEVKERADKPTITGNIVKEYLRHAKGKKALVFASGIQHSQNIMAVFNANDVSCQHLDGETPSDMRDEILKKFADGPLMVITSVDLFSEGFDCPGIEALILARPTASRGLARQMYGRALRPKAGKTHAILLDHAGVFSRHGLPDDEIKWTLADRTAEDKKKELGQVKVRTCPKCFIANRGYPPKCWKCGYVFPIESREVKTASGTLEAVDKEVLRATISKEKSKEMMACQSEEELVALGLRRGYKDALGWGRHIWRWRESKGLVKR
jgi:superfamily II DNA or RNA helicase